MRNHKNRQVALKQNCCRIGFTTYECRNCFIISALASVNKLGNTFRFGRFWARLTTNWAYVSLLNFLDKQKNLISGYQQPLVKLFEKPLAKSKTD